MGVVVFFSDFGWAGPYVGQMEAAALAVAPQVRVVHLMHDAPAFRADLAAYLLAAAARMLPREWVVCAVVDPGVGSARRALAVRTRKRWLVGPDNGLLAILARREGIEAVYALDVPCEAAPTFHGRDVFAPAAAQLACGMSPTMQRASSMQGEEMPEDLARVVYIDGFGNLVLGVRAQGPMEVRIGKMRLPWRRTFAEVPPGEALAYCGSLGLVEIAVREGSAAARFGLGLGDAVVCRASNAAQEHPYKA